VRAARRTGRRTAGRRGDVARSPRGRKRGRRTPRRLAARTLLALEGAGLVAIALLTAVVVLGEITDRLVGPARWWRPVLFAITVLGLGLTAAGGLTAWPRIRRGLAARAALLPPLVGLVLVAVALGLAARPGVQQRAAAVRRLLGGPDEALRETVTHQVYAAYRRADLAALERMLERARVYEPTIVEAASAFGIDPEVLVGIGAAESSFEPRDGADGGRGLFQITAPPAAAVANVRRLLGGDALDPRNERHNALLAAAALRQYLEQMHGDPFLALLAYNVGPRNGGLRAVMDHYGAHDFATMQPYLQRLPRDYPIRVLTAALAYRVRRREGRLPRYEEGQNAQRIQQLGIPGLS
jgi:soluble lytic murein transglycosylase-like protein